MRLIFVFLCVLTVLCGLAPTALGQPQARDTSAPPLPDARRSYFLRVENIALGRVEVSADGGAHYRLVGRVTQSAKQPEVDRSADRAGVILRSGPDGLAFSVAPGQALKLFPIPAPRLRKKRGKTFVIPMAKEAAGIYTDLPAKTGIFGVLRPAPGSLAQIQSATGRAEAFPEIFTTNERNVFVFSITPPEAPNQKPPATLREQLEILANTYDAGAIARARIAHRSIVSGTWTLRAKLPPDEPDPIVYVSYLVDDDTVATQNTAPFSFAWDTKFVSNGEHLVEIRALNRSGNLVTQVRALVVVDNPMAK